MTQNVEKFNRLIRRGFFRPEDFYNISIRSDKIVLQGDYDPDKVVALKISKFNHDIDVSGYLELRRSNIEIILT